MKNLVRTVLSISLTVTVFATANAQTTINIDELQASQAVATTPMVTVSDTVKTETVVATNEEILKMNIFDACKALGLSPEYSDRYDLIILPLCRSGVILFPSAEVNELKEDLQRNGRDVTYLECLGYGGSGAENAKLIRNLVANRHLIVNGKLVSGAAKKWKVVK